MSSLTNENTNANNTKDDPTVPFKVGGNQEAEGLSSKMDKVRFSNL